MYKLKLASELLGNKIISIQSGFNIGYVTGFLAKKEDMHIDLLIIESDEVKNPLYLLTQDIRTIDNKRIYVNNEDTLSDKQDLMRHKEIIDSGFSVMGCKVEAASGKKLGKVEDLSIDNTTFTVVKMHIKTNLLQRIFQHSLLIDRSNILDIKKDNTIVVKDGSGKSQSATASMISAIN